MPLLQKTSGCPPSLHPPVSPSHPSLCLSLCLSLLPSVPLSLWQIEKFKKANKYIKEDTIWSYTIQIARALNEMHSRSILHRDIKPKNVFLTGKNHVRMGDLGCAKFMKTGLARTQVRCGGAA